MILEAFAHYLQTAEPLTPASSILGRWLWERLTLPAESLCDRVLRAEIIIKMNSSPPREAAQQQLYEEFAFLPGYRFLPRSRSGRRLLRSLVEYASSYEQQKWSRWVHVVKATDFNRLYNKD